MIKADLNAFGEQDIYMRVLTNFCFYAKPYIRYSSVPKSLKIMVSFNEL